MINPSNPELVKLATEGANPDTWVEQFNQKEYSALLQRPGMPILPWVEALATGLDGRGARNIADKVRAGGLIVQTSLFEAGEFADEKRFIKTFNLLDYLDRTLPGLSEEASATGQAMTVLTMVLQELTNDQLTNQ